MRQRLRKLAGRVPAIARRDAELRRRAQRIQQLEDENAGAREAATPANPPRPAKVPAQDPAADQRSDRASFRTHLLELRRIAASQSRLDPDLVHPFRQVPHKLWIHRFGASHRVGVPQVYAVWPDLDAVTLGGLPDQFVLKSDRGAGGRGVLQVTRESPERYATRGESALTSEQVVQLLRPAVEAGRIFGPFFAEELLRTPAGEPVQDDLKLYCFYGEVGQVLLRRVGVPGDKDSVGYRYLAADGSDLGRVVKGLRIDPTIEIPDTLAEAVEVAQHLSRAVGLPFSRVDVYATDQGIVLGEITRAPGGPQRYRAAHDESMGRSWEEARWRLERDLATGRPYGMVFGEHPAPDHYPADFIAEGAVDPRRAVPVADCAQWCAPPAQ